MSYFSRVCMAATVAMVEGQTDQTGKYGSGLRTRRCGNLRPSFINGDFEDSGRSEGGDDKRKQVDESLQKPIDRLSKMREEIKDGGQADALKREAFSLAEFQSSG